MNGTRPHIEEKIVPWTFFKENDVKLHNRKIVFTNGCFYVLHYGHVRYLLDAKSLGDLLVVGLNSDGSVRRLKGESRPINGEKERAFVLAALDLVDDIVVFEEDTPEKLIETVKTDVLVKGGDVAVRAVDIAGGGIDDSGGVVRHKKTPFSRQ